MEMKKNEKAPRTLRGGCGRSGGGRAITQLAGCNRGQGHGVK